MTQKNHGFVRYVNTGPLLPASQSVVLIAHKNPDVFTIDVSTRYTITIKNTIGQYKNGLNMEKRAEKKNSEISKITAYIQDLEAGLVEYDFDEKGLQIQLNTVEANLQKLKKEPKSQIIKTEIKRAKRCKRCIIKRLKIWN